MSHLSNFTSYFFGLNFCPVLFLSVCGRGLSQFPGKISSGICEARQDLVQIKTGPINTIMPQPPGSAPHLTTTSSSCPKSRLTWISTMSNIWRVSDLDFIFEINCVKFIPVSFLFHLRASPARCLAEFGCGFRDQAALQFPPARMKAVAGSWSWETDIHSFTRT